MNKIILKDNKEMKMRVENFEQYSKFPSTDFLMLCELIDNSISSFLDKDFNPNGDIRGFKMELIIDRKDTRNPNVTITDNSNGMNEETLEKALILGNDISTVKSTSLNVHGVGLKQSSFFLGQKIEIKSIPTNSKVTFETEINLKELLKTEDQIIRYSIFKTENKIVTSEGKIYPNGTQIKISFLRSRRLSNAFDILVQNLGWKYGEYINRGAEIKIRFINNESNGELSKINSRLPKAENISNWLMAIKKKSAFIKDYKTSDFLNKIKDNIESISKKENNDMVSSLFQKIINEEDLIWDFNEEIIDGIRIFGQIGILADPRSVESKQTYVKYNGFSLYQAGRAVACGPNDKKNETKTYVPNKLIQEDISGGTNHKRRWFGWFNLDPLFEGRENKYVQLDTNKRNISWMSDAAQNNFDESIKNIANKLDSCLRSITDAQNNFCKTESNVKKADLGTVSKMSSNKENLIIKEEAKKRGSKEDIDETTYLVKIDGEDLNFTINLRSLNSCSKDEDFITYEKYEDDELNFSVILNLNHDLWRPIITEEITTASLFSFHKICITFCLSQYIYDYINNPSNKQKSLPPNFKNISKFKDKNYTDIACEIANRISITNGK